MIKVTRQGHQSWEAADEQQLVSISCRFRLAGSLHVRAIRVRQLGATTGSSTARLTAFSWPWSWRDEKVGSTRTEGRALTIMSDWFTTIVVGMAMTVVYSGLVFLLYRQIVKRMRAEREEERRRRRSFDWEEDR